MNKFGRLDHAMRRRSQSMEYRKSQGESLISIEGVSGCEYSPTKISGFGAECNSVEGSMTLTTPYIH